MHNLLNKVSPEQWVKCSGSVIGKKEQRDTEYTESQLRGIKAHQLAAYYLHNDIKSMDIKCKEEDCPDMIEAVKCYVANVQALSGMQEEKQAEKDVQVFFKPELSNYIDYYAATEGEEIHIHEFKFGMSEVLAHENTKLIIYALSCMPIGELLTKYKLIRFFLHQPNLRGQHVSEWTRTPVGLYEYYLTIQEKAERAECVFENPDNIEEDDYSAGAHCKNCGHFNGELSVCKHLIDEVIDYVSMGTDDIEAIRKVDSSKIDYLKLFELGPLIEGIFAALKKEAIQKIESGEEIKQLKIVSETCGKRSWHDEEKTEQTLKGMKVRLEDRFNKTLISPAQAQKILSPQRWKKIQGEIKMPGSRPRLVSEADPRPSITASINDVNEDIQPLSCEVEIEEGPCDMRLIKGVR